MEGRFLMDMWARNVVSCLCEMKRQGQDFEAAWKRAIMLYKPSGRSARDGEQLSLEEPSETLVEFLHRACRDAWHGERPALGALPDLVDVIAA